MARYTQARLTYALSVFRETLPYRNKRNLKAPNLEQHLKKYALRGQAVTTDSGRPGLWHDKDDSGDYDPAMAKKRQPDPRLSKSHRPKREKRESDADRGVGRPRKRVKISRSWLSGRMLGESLEITLKLTSDAGKTLLGKLLDEGICSLESEGRRRAEDEKPSLWAQGGRSFSRIPRSSFCSAARRLPILGPDADDENDRSIPNCGLGLRTRTIPTKRVGRGVRRLTKCLPCRLSGSRCGLKKSSTAHCMPCRKAGVECVPDLLDNSGEKKERLAPGISHDDPSSIMSSSSEVCRNTRWIDTNWSHPMDFKFKVDTRNPTKVCHFCSDYRYSITGFGLKRVEVIVEENGYTYHEMGDGHREAGVEPTNMCIRCALGRFAICRCANHAFTRYRTTYDNNQLLSAWAHLFDSNGLTRDPTAAESWCHFCLIPATHACRARQECDLFGKPLAPGAPVKSGCGLLLCVSCVGHVEEFGIEDRERLEEAIQERRIGKVRADMEFLFAGSDMHKAYGFAN